MKALSLFVVLVVAHLLMIAGRTAPPSLWAPIAYLWQDLLVALLFGLVDRFVTRSSLSWSLYAILVFYSAINVPIARVLSSPLTWPMMRAARGPLRDSITHYLTAPNIGFILVVLAAGLLLPQILKRTNVQIKPGVFIGAIVVTALGPLSTMRIDTFGLHRNAYGALWPSRKLSASASDGNAWRVSPFPSRVTDDQLGQYRTLAAGRNVILIALESTAAKYLALYGASPDPMPNLTELASQAVVFDRAYTVYPESIKGLIPVLCSQYPAFQTAAEDYANSQCPSLAQLLADAGYHTALFHSGRFMYLGMEAIVNNRGFQTMEDAGAIGGNVNSSFGIDEGAAVSRLLAWIDSLPPDQPFFVTYLPVAGHHPYATAEPGPFPNESDFGNYLNALHYGDKALGELRQGLKHRALENKTLYILFGDHGEAFGQHEGNLGHSLFIYDENVRVPYLIAAPGLIEKELRARQTASLIDTAPTILDLLGLPIPPEFQGRSLLNSDGRMALFFTDYSLGFLGLFDTCWKYIFEINSNRSKLYDVCRDPDEVVDLSARETRRVDAYRKSVESWIGSQKPPR